MPIKTSPFQFLHIVLLISLFLTGCHHLHYIQNKSFIPAAPVYTDELMWYTEITDTGQTGADIFYIPSTWEYDWYTPDSIISHYADPSNPTHRARMNIEMKKIARYMAEGNNFYSPYYRHISLNSWATLNEDTINRRYNNISFTDITAAFNYFIDHKNNNRPFILAGFSQGGKSVVELLKIMPDNIRKRMIAAYVLGYKVTPQDLIECPSIKAASDSIDTGVTICYNSVADIKYIKPIVSTPCVMCINPVNWKTDATPAILNDTITVTLNPEYNVLVLQGYDGSRYKPILNILNTGDFHGAEPWLYSECLRTNIRQRIKAYKANKHSD